MKRTTWLLLGLLSLSACQQGVNAPIQARQDPYPEDQLMIAQEDLRRKTAFDRPILTRDAQSGILYVTVPVRNTSDKQLFVDYRFTFLDANGQETFKTGWINKVLAPNVPDRITANSTSARAIDFRMDLRWAR